ncbi:hypothetical protein NVP1015O_47 [Vibrio phage 1.015.O._10N.222.51.E5]|nr:hypothetical protein NVP1015O_47 [Vibrio phage 1.015.O._10N.222.51.E5]
MIESLTVKELIEELQQLDPDMEVYSGSDYGDRLNTTQANPVGCIGTMYLHKSAYSSTGYKLDEEASDHEVYVLNSDSL